MPTITPADALLTAAGDLREAIHGGIPQSQYDKGIVDQFMAILNANDKNYQSDSVLRTTKSAVREIKISKGGSCHQ